MIRPIFKVGPKERLIRSLMGLEPVQRWLPSLASRLHSPTASIAREFSVDYHGFTYRGQTNNTIDWCVYFLKNFSTAEASLVQSVGGFVRRRDQRYVCMDVGANVGHRTLTMACFADEVVALEPMPGAFERLSEKVAFNALSQVKPFQIAFSNQTEDVDFEILSPCNFLAVRRSDLLTCGAFETQTLSAVRGDDFIRDHLTQPPHFIRFAVGSETTRALEGLSETLRSARPVVFIECPPIPFGQATDAEGLKSLLYDDVEIFTFDESLEDGTFALESFDLSARKLVCIPSEIVRVAYQEACRNHSLRMKAGV